MAEEGARFLLAWCRWGEMTGKEPKKGKTEMSGNRETDVRARPPNGAKRMRASGFSHDPPQQSDGQNLHKQPSMDKDAGPANLLQSLATPVRRCSHSNIVDKDMEAPRH